MAYVFVSYARVNADFVEILKNRLKEAGFEVWIDSEHLRAGDDWREGIDTAIRESMAMIAVMSPEAYESKYVTYEWAFAHGIGIKVIPVMLQKTDLHPRMDVWQYLDFTHRQGRPWPELIGRLGEVADNEGGNLSFRLSSRVPYPVQHAVAGLDSRNKQERLDAIDTLKQMKHIPEAIDALAHAVTHEIRDVRMNAALILAQVTSPPDPRATSGLVEVLRVKDEKIENTSIEVAQNALAQIKDRSTVPALIEILKDRHSTAQGAAATILGEIGDSAATPALIDAMNAGSKEAIKALGRIKDASAVSALIEKAKEQLPLFHSSRSLTTVIQVLESIGVPETPEILAEYKSVLEAHLIESARKNINIK